MNHIFCRHTLFFKQVLPGLFASAILTTTALADNAPMTASTMDMTRTSDDTATASMMQGPMDHGRAPSGVHAANVIDAGKLMFGYNPMFMHMEDNYMGSSKVSPQTIVTTIPSKIKMGPMYEMYRVVPSSMDVEAHMFSAMYGVTDSVSVMVMAPYLIKTMAMTTFAGAMGATALGASHGKTEGLGDTSLASVYRLHKDHTEEVLLDLGLSLPTGSITENITMLSPMNKMMTMRGSYGMQLGTGTVDLMSGATYKGYCNDWSWGAAWRGRVAMDTNSKGYRYGDQHELTGWGGYSWMPGVTATLRIDGTVQDRIHGADPMITGLMQGTNPAFYGGTLVDLLGGITIDGNRFGLKNTSFAIEAGDNIHQHLNGPQLGRSSIIDLAIRVGL